MRSLVPRNRHADENGDQRNQQANSRKQCGGDERGIGAIRGRRCGNWCRDANGFGHIRLPDTKADSRPLKMSLYCSGGSTHRACFMKFAQRGCWGRSAQLRRDFSANRPDRIFDFSRSSIYPRWIGAPAGEPVEPPSTKLRDLSVRTNYACCEAAGVLPLPVVSSRAGSRACRACGAAPARPDRRRSLQ
jgi:hypothetical protein